MKVIIYLIFTSILMISSGCEKFLDIGTPENQVDKEAAFSSNETATSTLMGLYVSMMNTPLSTYGLIAYSGLSADEIENFSNNGLQIQLYENSLDAGNTIIANIWELYKLIYMANSIIEGVENATSISAAVKQRLVAEATFLRAYTHFYLLNFFGDIPYIKTTDFRSNSQASREPVDKVYQLLILDLLHAVDNLDDNYVGSDNTVSTERVRVNKSVALALLSKVYLFNKEWNKSEVAATQVLSNTSKYDLESDLQKVFIKNSKESIWSLSPVIPGQNTWEGANFILKGYPTSVALRSDLVASFTENDQRKTFWIDSVTSSNKTYYFPSKYKQAVNSTSSIVNEYAVMLRVSEIYLIRAEARLQQKRIDESKADLDKVRLRAGLNRTTASNEIELALAIEEERLHELFTEGANRWFDLKRTNRADAVLKSIKPDWQPTDQLYPIPLVQLQSNNQMKQNPGYN